MKFLSLWKVGPSKNQVNRPRQPVLQPLESRRLMSLSGAIEYPPAAVAAPPQFAHSFGFENHLPTAGDSIPPLPPAFGAAETPVNPTSAQATAVPALAHASVTAIVTAATPTATAEAASHSLSAMYATLNNSTVAEIDNAAQSTNTTAASDLTFQKIEASAVVSSPQLQVRPSTESVASAGAPMIAATTAVTASPTGPAALVDAPLHFSPQAVEAELLAISSYAGQVISQLGRDLAIDLSHLTDAQPLAMMTAPGSGWKFAAAAGAAVAAAAFVQSHARREKPKSASVFSVQLIDVIPE